MRRRLLLALSRFMIVADLGYSLGVRYRFTIMPSISHDEIPPSGATYHLPICLFTSPHRKIILNLS